MENLTLSIIIPTFNSGSKLNETLDSIICQTFTKFEVLIIDSLSNDNTLDIIKKYASLNSNIRWVSESDKGIYDAMNKGVNLAKGDWIYFLGSDDRIFDNKVIANIVHIISQRDCEIIYGNVISSRFNGIYDGEFNALKILQKNICHQAVFLKKDVFNKVGFFNLRYRSHADWDHNMRWLLSIKVKKTFIDKVIAEYGDGGFSSLNKDVLFEKDKVLNFLQYAKRQLYLGDRITLLLKEVKKSVRGMNILYLLKLISKTPRIILGY